MKLRCSSISFRSLSHLERATPLFNPSPRRSHPPHTDKSFPFAASFALTVVPLLPLENPCHFSPDRVHRYSLIHRLDPLLGGDRLIMWIGLNPSTADESQLDPTLRRIARFSERDGYDGFWMANIFGLRTPYPKEMMAHADPVGPGNDASLLAAAARCEKIVAAWGVSGAYQARAEAVVRLLAPHKLWCLSTTAAGHPRHPLYVHGDQILVRYTPTIPSL